jgi:hypothetical protein
MKLEKIFVHANSAYPFHGRSPLFEIRNDLILGQSMPSEGQKDIQRQPSHAGGGVKLRDTCDYRQRTGAPKS